MGKNDEFSSSHILEFGSIRPNKQDEALILAAPIMLKALKMIVDKADHIHDIVTDDLCTIAKDAIRATQNKEQS